MGGRDMGFLTSNDNFNAVFGQEAEKTPYEKFMAELGVYLRKKETNPYASEIGRCISAGIPLAAFSCREDVIVPMTDALYERNVPYIVIGTKDGKTGILLRKSDSEKADDAKKEVLEALSRRCTVLSGKDMIHNAAKVHETDKTCLAIHGLKPAHAQFIKEGYAQYLPDKKIGLDRMQDGTYSLIVMAASSIKKNARTGPDLCTIFLEAALKAGGPNAEMNGRYADSELRYQNGLAKSFKTEGVNLNKTPLWIVGTGRHYVKISGFGFTYGCAVTEGKEVSFKTEYQASIDQPDYRQLLVSYTSRIPYKEMTFNPDEVILHYSNISEEDYYDPLNASPTAQYRMWARGEKEMAGVIDKAVTIKIQRDDIMLMDGRWNEKFKHYLDELSKVFNALMMGHLPAGYEIEDEEKLKKIMEKYRLEGVMFEQAIIDLQQIEAIGITHTIERIADVNERIGISRNEIQMEKDREREEREARRLARARGASPAPPAPGTAPDPGEGR